MVGIGGGRSFWQQLDKVAVAAAARTEIQEERHNWISSLPTWGKKLRSNWRDAVFSDHQKISANCPLLLGKGGSEPKEPPPVATIIRRHNFATGVHGVPIDGNVGAFGRGETNNSFSVFGGVYPAGVFYDASVPRSGSGRLHAKASSGTGAAGFVGWGNLGLAANSVWGRLYIFLPVLAKSQFVKIQTTALALSAEFAISAVGVMGVVDAAASPIAALAGVVSVPIGEWLRFEFRVKSSTTVGEIDWRLYHAADGSLPDESRSATGLALGDSSDAFAMGLTNSGVAANTTLYFDDPACSNDDWLGPVTTPSALGAYQ